MRTTCLRVWLVGFGLLTSCAPREPEPALGPVTITLKSSTFSEGSKIPATYTCDGKDSSPALSWSNLPPKTQSLALVCEDPDAPMGTWTHWVAYHIDPSVTSIPEAAPAREELSLPNAKPAQQGMNDFGKPGYGGPCPPSGTHRYVFHLYALDAVPKLSAGATRTQLLDAMKGHVLAEGRLMGKYARQK